MPKELFPQHKFGFFWWKEGSKRVWGRSCLPVRVLEFCPPPNHDPNMSNMSFSFFFSLTLRGCRASYRAPATWPTPVGFGETKLEGHSYSWVEMGEGASGEAKNPYFTFLRDGRVIEIRLKQLSFTGFVNEEERTRQKTLRDEPTRLWRSFDDIEDKG